MPRVISCLIWQPSPLAEQFGKAVGWRWIAGATLAMAAAFGVGRFAYTPLLPEMRHLYNWTYSQAGDIASSNFLGYLVGALVAPALFRLRPPQLLLALVLIASVATTALGGWAQSYEQWLVLRFASGVASAAVLIVLTTWLTQMLQQSGQSTLGNLHVSGVGVGIVLTVLVLQPAVVVSEHWFDLGALAALCMALAWVLMRPLPITVTDAQMSGARESSDSEASATSRIPLFRLVAGYGLFGYGYVVAATFVVALSAQLASQSSQSLQSNPEWVWLIVGAAIIPSVALWQWLANRWGYFAALRLAYAVEAVGLFLAAVASSQTQLAWACVLLGGTFSAITALGLSAARELEPSRVAWMISAMTAAFSVGQLIGPLVSGRLADLSGGFFWPMMVAGVTLAMAAALVSKPSQSAVRS